MNTPLGVIGRPTEILHVDDQPDYVELTREAFQMAGFAVNLHHAKDGEQGMAFVRKEGQHIAAPTPDIILLDLNMPRMNGWEFMAEISKDKNLCHLPVVILTSSGEEHEILKVYQLRCSSYIVKPLDYSDLIRFIKSFADFWLNVAILPSTRRPQNGVEV